MSTCQFYNLYTKELQSNEIRPDRQSSDLPVINVPFCNHKHSPLPRDKVAHIIRGQISLTCNGEISKCQVPRDKIADI
jgi:hypothetical protein